ncbi:hypothetical protein [Marinobacterium stanieri]|uniref:hypothetical protein n=1 Tax=Marinobacterium stanieri TaxID=49186 RepID=UPI003A8D786C
MAYLDLGSVESRRLVGHLLAQVDLGEKGLPVLDSGVTELLELNARLEQLRQVQAGLRDGARLEDLLN